MKDIEVKKKEVFTPAVIEVIRFESEDIIRTSGNGFEGEEDEIIVGPKI